MNKRVLIVDDEESVLFVLKKSLRKLGDQYDVDTATNGYQALEMLQAKTYDLIVTDYRMTGMNGLQLMEAVRATQPRTRMVMITAYGNEALEAEAKRLQVYRYLTKPLDVFTFRKIIKEALEGSGEMAVSRPGLLILSDERYRQVITLLERLKGDVGGRCIILTDGNGHIIARTGDMTSLQIAEIASLLSGSMATLQAAGQALDGEESAINLSYREGKRDCLYVINIGQHLLLILVIENSPFSSRLGSVWYYARQAALTLRKKLGEAEYATTMQLFDEKISEVFEDELDKLFGADEDEEAGALSVKSATPIAVKTPVATPTTVTPPPGVTKTAVAPPPSIPPTPEAPPAPAPGKGKLMSLEDAIALGVLPQNFQKADA